MAWMHIPSGIIKVGGAQVLLGEATLFKAENVS